MSEDINIDSADSKWIDLLETHKETWRKNENSSKTEKIQLMENQLSFYYKNYGLPLLYGRGSLKAKVVFLALHPSPHDQKEEEAFAEGNWVNVLTDKIDTILEEKDYYLMYLFPYYLGREKNPSELKKTIFLSFAKQRLIVIAPRLIISLGSSATKHLFSCFGGTLLSMHQLISTTTMEKKPKKINLSKGIATGFLVCPHPFQLMEFIYDYKTQRQINNQAFSSEFRQIFDTCFQCIDKIINQFKIRGPQIEKDGEIMINVLPAMLTGAKSFYGLENTSKKRKTPEKSNHILKGQTLLNGFFKTVSNES